MANLTQRNIEVLKIIIEEYIKTWEVLWSKLLLRKYDLWVSSATIRNDMALLEKLELIYQPYHSAWRLPTTKGLRAFVTYMMRETPDFLLEAKNETINTKTIRELSDYIHSIVYNLAKNTQEIAFFILPEKHISEYSGVAGFLERNHGRIGDDIYQLLKMLEDKPQFSKFIQSFWVEDSLQIFIWEENFLPYLKNYSIILKPVILDESIWYIGIIWGLKMNYSFNISAVRGIM